MLRTMGQTKISLFGVYDVWQAAEMFDLSQFTCSILLLSHTSQVCSFCRSNEFIMCPKSRLNYFFFFKFDFSILSVSDTSCKPNEYENDVNLFQLGKEYFWPSLFA